MTSLAPDVVRAPYWLHRHLVRGKVVNEDYVVTRDPRPVTHVSQLDGLRRMDIESARKLLLSMAHVPSSARIIRVTDLWVMS